MGQKRMTGNGKVDWRRGAQAASGLSHADIVRACEQAAKNAIIEHRTEIHTEGLLESLRERHSK